MLDAPCKPVASTNRALGDGVPALPFLHKTIGGTNIASCDFVNKVLAGCSRSTAIPRRATFVVTIPVALRFISSSQANTGRNKANKPAALFKKSPSNPYIKTHSGSFKYCCSYRDVLSWQQ